MKIAVRIATVVSFALTAGLVATGVWWLIQLPPEEPLPDISRDAVLDVSFNADDLGQYAHIETGKVIVATTIRDVRFVESPDTDKMTLLEHDMRKQPVMRWSPMYTLLIPTGKLREISGRYAETFNENLPLESED